MTLFEGDIVKEFQGDFRFLSNFYPVKIHMFGFDFDSVEHGYQAFKWDFSDDETITDDVREEEIRKFTTEANITAAKAKRMGKKIPVDTFQWEIYKTIVMDNLLFEKFKNPELRELLKKTRGMHLQEGNGWGDTYWGVDLATGKGKNVLGNMLMVHRDRIIMQDEPLQYIGDYK